MSKAALTNAGRTSQTMNKPSRGKVPANNANRQPMAVLLSGLRPLMVAAGSGARFIPEGWLVSVRRPERGLADTLSLCPSPIRAYLRRIV
ncbi:hypothetical protein GCM10020369_35890 [Cryptosporangium minutisporangium]|uniref:Uncharacterized protein n=1 Tax=Cryptosporangium minutisporangium TaxID=113569 RepID=A0ABP6SYJ7_9ACTN